jgi:hypothetical protein
MSVTVRPYRRGWEIDIRWRDAKGARHRERLRTTITSKTAARRWDEDRERELLLRRPEEQAPKEVPILRVFLPQFIDGHSRANPQKPSGIAGKDTAGRRHLLPMWGDRRLDHISTEDVQRLKAQLSDARR